MRVAILGAGGVGRAIATGLRRGGHEVVFGTRGAPRVEDGESLVSYADAVDGADLVVLAIPGDALEELLRENATLLDGRLLADTTNVIHQVPYHQLGLFSRYVPAARVARAWCSIGSSTMLDPSANGVASDLLWCGLEGDDVTTLESLIASTGFKPQRTGGLESAHIVDYATRVVLSLIFEQGWPHDMGIQLLRRD